MLSGTKFSKRKTSSNIVHGLASLNKIATHIIKFQIGCEQGWLFCEPTAA